LVKLVPHIFRLEVYAGKNRTVYDPEDIDKKSESENKQEKCEVNESPVNFFQPDYETYPLFNEAERKYLVILHEGDCVYIPSFYFHQYAAK
jgi:Cupin-like domain